MNMLNSSRHKKYWCRRRRRTSSVKYVCNEAYDLFSMLASGELIIDAATPSSEQAGIGMYWYGRIDLKRE